MAPNIVYKNVSHDLIASGEICIKTSLSALSDEEGNPKPFTSTSREIGGLSWRMEVRKIIPSADGPPRLDLYIFCNENVKDKLWLCNVHFSVHCTHNNPMGAGYFHIRQCQHEYGPLYGFNTYFWIFEDIGNELQIQPKVLEPIAITLEIKIMHIQKSFPPLDATLVIKTDENPTAGTFSINKYALAYFSNYFSNLFFGDWSDKKKAENYFEIVESNDFDVQEFGFMIYSIMTIGGMINRSNYVLNEEDDNDVTIPIKIVKMAIKYDMAIMVDYCEKVLMDCKDHSKLDLLELSDQYPELNKLKEKCLNGLSIQDLTKNLAKTTPIISRLSENTKQRLDAIMAGKTEEMCNSLVTMNDEIRAKKPRLSLDKMKKVILGNE